MSKLKRERVTNKLRFKNRNGDVSIYGFMCGYQQVLELNSDNRVVLEASGAVYSVKGFIAGKSFWEVDESLTKARELFRAKCREAKQSFSNQEATTAK